jgi:NAD(P)-dependent dehydrogenase (short-subunit alcohol dehydrogenase family)
MAEEGARVFLAGRSAESLAPVARELRAVSHVVEGTDEAAVTSWVDEVAARAGIDVVFNAVGPRAAVAGYAQPSPALPLAQFTVPLQLIVISQFLSARAAARHMLPRGRGSIVFLSASLTGHFIPFMAGITAACGAVEALSRTLAAEFGPAGVRVNCVRAGGMTETRTIIETSARMAVTMGATADTVGRSGESTVLQRAVRVDETARAVAWLASDEASGIAGQVVNVCAGAIVSR